MSTSVATGCCAPWAGAAWASSTKRSTRRSTARSRSSWNWITFTRWRDPQAEKAYYRDWFNPSHVDQREWYRSGERHGVHRYGRSGTRPGNRRWRDVHVYEKQPWTVAVNAGSMDARDRGVDKVSGYRLPSRLKGVPIS